MAPKFIQNLVGHTNILPLSTTVSCIEITTVDQRTYSHVVVYLSPLVTLYNYTYALLDLKTGNRLTSVFKHHS